MGTRLSRTADEKRRHPRFHFYADVETSTVPKHSGTALDVSAGGLRVELNHKLGIGERCNITVISPARTYRNQVEVVWYEPQGERHLTGLRFL